MKVFAETGRLILREVLLTDVDGFFELDADPEVHRFLGNKPVADKEQSLNMIRFIRQQYHEHGIGRWAMIEKETGNFIGWTGLKFVTEKINGHINYYDVGYRLIKKFWGRGFATESAIASLAYGFDQLGLNKIYAAAHAENHASNRILTKIGLQMSGTFTYNDAVHHWYEMDVKKWNSSRPAQ